MPHLGPISRRELVQCLRNLGFEGPFSGGKHQFMVRGEITLRVPNPHQGDLSLSLLSRILRQAGVSKDDWESL